MPTVNKFLEAIAPTLTTKTIGILISDLKNSIFLITFAGILALSIGYGLIHGARKFARYSAYTYVGVSLFGTIIMACLFLSKYNTMISTM